MKNGQPKLRALDVGMEYFEPRTGRRVTALHGFNLDIEEGQFVSLVGPSGCGKTTFLKIVDGLLQPTAGQILLDGRPIRKSGRDRAMVFQEASLIPWRTVLRNVTYGLECQRVPLAQATEQARRTLQLVGLTGFEHAYPHELSGGMQQRANLARALAVDPELLLMDEPFAALDAQTREIMQRELLKIWQRSRKTVLFVTHQIDEAIFLADRVVVLTGRPGRVAADIGIDIPRPRTLEVKRETRFTRYVDEVWRLIEAEVVAAMGLRPA